MKKIIFVIVAVAACVISSMNVSCTKAVNTANSKDTDTTSVDSTAVDTLVVDTMSTDTFCVE